MTQYNESRESYSFVSTFIEIRFVFCPSLTRQEVTRLPLWRYILLLMEWALMEEWSRQHSRQSLVEGAQMY